MSFRKNVTMALWLLLALMATTVEGQSIVGVWKRTSVLVTDKDGKNSEVQTMLEKSMPCMAGIRYEFTTAGMQKTIVPEACKKSLSAMAAMFGDVPYSLSGNKVFIKSPNKKMAPDATYVYQIKGSVMTWSFSYLDNPETPNPTKAKSMTIQYQKQ
jgi:hypothetical protein